MPIISPSLASASSPALAGAGRLWPRAEGTTPERQCGRCRQYFDADATAATVQEWWLCEPCHDAVFGVQP